MMTVQAARDLATAWMAGGTPDVGALTQLILAIDREAVAAIEQSTLRNHAKAAADNALSPFRAANLVAPDGGPRRVLGTLCLTVDGHIIGDGAVLHYPITVRWNDASLNPDGKRTVEHIPSFRVYLVSEDHLDIERQPDSKPFVCWGGPDHDCAGVDEGYSSREAAASALAARGEVEGC